MKSLFIVVLLFFTQISGANELNNDDGSWLLPVGTKFTTTKDIFIRANTSSFGLCNGSKFLYKIAHPEYKEECFSKLNSNLLCYFSFTDRDKARVLKKGSSFIVTEVTKNEWSDTGNSDVWFSFHEALETYLTVTGYCYKNNQESEEAMSLGDLKNTLNGFMSVVQPLPDEVGTCQKN